MFKLLQSCVRNYATKKSGGSSANGRTSNPKYLGFKKTNNALVKPGDIIVRQRGTQYFKAEGVGMGKDHTLFSLIDGRVMIYYDLEKQRRMISVRQDGLVLPSKQVTKQRLREMIDVDEYLKQDPKGRYSMVFEKIAELGKEMKNERDGFENELKAVKGSRKFNLSDLTML